MKKTLLFAAVALVLGSCANEADVYDPAAPESISFKAVTQKQTRGAFAGTTLPVTTDIYVGAYNKIASPASYNEYFSDACFTCYDPSEPDPNNRVWVGKGMDYFYPPLGDIDFLAYTCDSGSDQKKPAATWTPNVAGQYIEGLTLDFSAEPLDGQCDVCYSDVTRSTRLTEGGFSTPNLKFHHSLAWIMVNFSKGTSGYADDAFKIRCVKLNTVNLTGNLALSITSEGVISPTWTPAGAAADAYFPAFPGTDPDGMSFGDATTADTKGILVIPCTEQEISFEYCTKNGVDAGGNPVYTAWTPYTTTVSGALNWVAGKKYVYNFTIQSSKIEFTVDVVEYTPESENLVIK